MKVQVPNKLGGARREMGAELGKTKRKTSSVLGERFAEKKKERERSTGLSRKFNQKVWGGTREHMRSERKKLNRRGGGYKPRKDRGGWWINEKVTKGVNDTH